MMQVMGPSGDAPGGAPAVLQPTAADLWAGKRTTAMGAVTGIAVILAVLIVVRRGPEALRRPNAIVIGAVVGLAVGFDLRLLMASYDVLDPIGMVSTIMIAAVGGGVGGVAGWALAKS